MMKRLISMFAALCMLLTMMPQTAWAANLAKPDRGWAVPVQVNPRYEEVLDRDELAAQMVAAAYKAEPRAEVYVPEEEAIQQIRDAMKARKNEFTIYIRTQNTASGEVVQDCLLAAFDHTGVPTEGDYLAWQYAGWGVPSYSRKQDGAYTNIRVTYTVGYYDTAAQQPEMDAAVENLLDELDLYGATDYEKICGIYEYMTENIVYDYDHLADPSYELMYTAYAALINGTSVCQGYANLFYRLALELGVDNRIIVGEVPGGGHAWNIVELDGRYYLLDSTWDASSVQVGLGYYYFLKGSNNFKDHVADLEWCSFYNQYDISKTDYDPNGSNQGPQDPEEPEEPDVPVGVTGPNAFEWELLKLVNRERHAAGVDPLTTGELMFQVGDIRALEISEYFSHIRPNGWDYATVLDDVYYEWQYAGENIAVGQQTPEEVMEAWMNSEGHRANILDPDFTHMAPGYLHLDDDMYGDYWVQVFTCSWDCRFYDIMLNHEVGLEVEKGTQLEDMDLWAYAGCLDCGAYYLPILPEYCSGYDPNKVGIQTVTVNINGRTDTLKIAVGTQLPELHPDPDPEPELPDVDYLAQEWEVLALVNRVRRENGLVPLTTSELLFLAGDIRAEELTEVFGHTRPNGDEWGEALRDAGIEGHYRMSAEAIASGQYTAEEVVAYWLGNPEYNGLFKWDGPVHLGVGYEEAAGGPCWSVIFLKTQDCNHINDLTLSMDKITVEKGTPAENLKLWGAVNCYQCGTCYLPILPEYYDGYDPNRVGTQYVTVKVPGCYVTVEITVTGEMDPVGGQCGDNVSWFLDTNGVLTFSGTGRMWDYPYNDPEWFVYREHIRACVVEEGVTSIGDRALYCMTALESVEIAGTVDSIGNYAFTDTALTELVIPEGVTGIGRCAFYECEDLVSVELPESISLIADSAFYSCTRLETIAIPEGVTLISLAAFSNCTGLTSVEIPESVTTVEPYAFSDCISLTDVYFGGTQSQWEQIEIGWDNDYLTGATIHYGKTDPNRPDPGTGCGMSEEAITQILWSMQEQYPEGMPWTNDNSYRWNINNTMGYGCAAFAFILSDEVFGYLPSRKIESGFSIEMLRPGDIIRMNDNSHSAVVLEVYDDYVVLAEGNYNSSIHWGRRYTAQQVEQNTTYVYTRYPEHTFVDGICTGCGKEAENVEIPVTNGDCNGDGKVTGLDLIQLRQYLASWEVSPDRAGADCNGDGKVNGLDLILLRQYLAGWDVTLGART